MHTEENHTNVLCVKTQSSTYSKKNINLNSDDVWECIYTVKKHHSSYSMKKKHLISEDIRKCIQMKNRTNMCVKSQNIFNLLLKD